MPASFRLIKPLNAVIGSIARGPTSARVTVRAVTTEAHLVRRFMESRLTDNGRARAESVVRMYGRHASVPELAFYVRRVERAGVQFEQLVHERVDGWGHFVADVIDEVSL